MGFKIFLSVWTDAWRSDVVSSNPEYNKQNTSQKHKYKHACIHGQTYIQHTNTQTHPYNHRKPHKVITEQTQVKQTICLPSPTVNNDKNYWGRTKGGCIVHVMGAISIWSFRVYVCCTTVFVSPFLCIYHFFASAACSMVHEHNAGQCPGLGQPQGT